MVPPELRAATAEMVPRVRKVKLVLLELQVPKVSPEPKESPELKAKRVKLEPPELLEPRAKLVRRAGMVQ